MDFPSQTVGHKPVLSPFSAESLGVAIGNSRTALASATWPAANRAEYFPIKIDVPYLVKRWWWLNGAAAAGNVDCGLYSSGGALLASAGSTAQTGTTVIQSVALGTALLLTPGSYYLALASDSASATFFRSSGMSAGRLTMEGVAQQNTAFVLPASFTLAAMGNAHIPMFGISRSSVI